VACAGVVGYLSAWRAAASAGRALRYDTGAGDGNEPSWSRLFGMTFRTCAPAASAAC